MLLVTAYIGLPVSTTQTITTSVMGVGAIKRFSAVRWGVTAKILYAWIFMLPGAALLAWLIYLTGSGLANRWTDLLNRQPDDKTAADRGVPFDPHPPA